MIHAWKPAFWGGLITGDYLTRTWTFQFDRLDPVVIGSRLANLSPDLLDHEYTTDARHVYVTAEGALIGWLVNQPGDDTHRPLCVTEPEWSFKHLWIRLTPEIREAVIDYAMKINPLPAPLAV